MKKTIVIVLALALMVGALASCSGGSAKVEKSYWSVTSYVDDSNGAALDVVESYTLNVNGSEYQLTRAQRTTMDVWINISYYGSLFGTYTVTESGDELVYTLSAPTRGIYANGQIDAVTTQIDPTWIDSDDNATWPDTLDGENATTKDGVLAQAFGTGLGLGDTVTTITVRVDKVSGEITSVNA